MTRYVTSFTLLSPIKARMYIVFQKLEQATFLKPPEMPEINLPGNIYLQIVCTAVVEGTVLKL